MITVVLFLLIVVLVLYLSAVRSVFSKIHISRQLQKFGENNKQTERFHSLLDDYSRVDTGLKIFQMMARFFQLGYYFGFSARVKVWNGIGGSTSHFSEEHYYWQSWNGLHQ